MNIETIKNNLYQRLNVFPDRQTVELWLQLHNYSWITFFNKTAAQNAIQQYMLNTIKIRINEIRDDIKLSLAVADTADLNVNIDFDSTDHSAWGVALGGGAVALTAIIEGALFPPLLLAVAAGFVLGKDKNRDAFIDSVLTSSAQTAERLTQEISQELDNFSTIKKQKQLNPPAQQKVISEHSTASTLSYEQMQIKDFLEQRKIKYLVHFTNSENVESIMQHGILPVTELNKRNISFRSNDFYRLDHCLDAISLSITAPNSFVMNRFKKNGSLSGVSVFCIDARILYEKISTPRIYCDRNAAASSCKKGRTLFDLQNMFTESLSYTTTEHSYSYNRKTDNRPSNEPTDVQAEILFQGVIETKYIDRNKILDFESR